MDNRNGHYTEHGGRDYRPDLKPDHPRDHRAVWFTERAITIAAACLPSTCLHRLSFFTAAYDAQAFYLDMYQTVHELPYPEHGERFCGILNDDEPTRGGARGPTFFHQSSLARLVGEAKSVTVNCVGTVPYVYAQASRATAKQGLNSLLIETEFKYAMAWMNYCTNHLTGGRLALVRGKSTDVTKMSIISTPGSETMQ